MAAGPPPPGISMFLPLLSLLPLICNAFDLKNSVTGRPEVQCGIDSITVLMGTSKPFKGRMYVQGESEAEGCLKPMTEGGDVLKFELPIGACNMRRQRTLQPRGVAFSFTLVVSFHPLFVTGSDRAFSVRCFFLESVKALNTEVDVSQLTTEIVEQEFPLPQCTYEIREGLDGPSLKFAHVGQKVTHSWHCDPAVNWVYGMLIHSCYADDGRGNKFELVDEHGCTTDPSLLPQIQYDAGAEHAYTHSNVFKYADKIQLYFSCTVQLCYKHDGGCEGVTPPVCGAVGIGPGVPPVPPLPFPHGSPEKAHLPPVGKPVPPPPVEPPVTKIPDFVPPEVAGRIKDFITTPGKNGEHIPEEIEPRTGPILPGPPPPQGGPFRLPRPPFRKPFPPLKDSPLNLTEVDDVLTTAEVRRANSEFSEATPVGMVTVAPGLAHGTDTPSRTTSETLWPFSEETTMVPLKVFTNGQQTRGSKTTKGRRDLKKMETDLGVDVIVLPPQAETNMRSSGPSGGLFPPLEATICLSRPAAVIVFACLATIFLVGTVLTFVLTRNRRRSRSHKAHPMMDAFH